MTLNDLWSAHRATHATGGHATGDWTATGVSIDSRTLAPGDLFVALKGPNFDGHRFIADALAKGAAAVVAEAESPHLPPEAPALRVADTQRALEDLGRAARAQSRARVVGVTGSAGKTGTKEALRHVLATQGRVHAAVGSFNNHWGVPLTLARLPQDTDFAVIEMGMNHAGELAALTRMVRPDVAVITTVASAHIEFFNSEAEIAEAKAEILQGVPAGGTAVLPRDNVHYPRLRARAEAAGIAHIRCFGQHAEAEARALDIQADATGSTVTASLDGTAQTLRVGQPGEHWVYNALAVLLAAQALGADRNDQALGAEMTAAAAALATIPLPDGRGGRERVPLADGAFTLIDDSYNANPASMRAALSVLGTDEGGRRLAVLGDMKELGAAAADHHAALADPLAEAGVDQVFTCGPEMAALHAALPASRRGGHADTAAALIAAVTAALRPGDTVLVKGSASVRTGDIVAALRAFGASPSTTPSSTTAATAPPRAAGGA